MSQIEKVIIIGSGPAAWSAAVYTARADFNPMVFVGNAPGGQLMLTTVVENFPGFPQGIDGPLLMNQMREQAIKFKTQVVEETVTKIESSSDGLKVFSANGEYKTKSIIIATGASAKWLNVPGEKEFVGRGVSVCAVCDAAFFKDKDTIIVGGGDAAMEDALALSRFAKTVKIVHRRDSFRASKVMVEKVKHKDNVSVIWNSQVSEIRGDKFVEEVEITNVEDNSKSILPVNGVFVAVGHAPTTSFLEGSVDLDEKGYVKTSLTHIMDESTNSWLTGYPTMTNVTGVFAGGDCVDFRYRQASTAAGYGVMAALDSERYLESLN